MKDFFSLCPITVVKYINKICLMDYFTIQFEVTNHQDGESRATNNAASVVLRSKVPPTLLLSYCGYKCKLSFIFYLLACLPTAMLSTMITMNSSSETVSTPLTNAVYISHFGHGVLSKLLKSN